MRNIQDYLNAAIELQQLGSDRQLARLIGMSSSALNAIRLEKNLPAPETMVKLADLAGISKEQALLELSYWSAEGEAKATYERLIKRLGVTAATLAMLIFANIPQANAALSPIHFAKNMYTYVNDTVYYGKSMDVMDV